MNEEIKVCKVCHGVPTLRQTESHLLWIVKCSCGREGKAECFPKEAIMNWDKENDK